MIAIASELNPNEIVAASSPEIFARRAYRPAIRLRLLPIPVPSYLSTDEARGTITGVLACRHTIEPHPGPRECSTWMWSWGNDFDGRLAPITLNPPVP